MRLVWFAAILAGCSPALREAHRHEQDGDYYRSSQVWMHLLEEDLDNSAARRHLRKSAPQAYKNLIDIAQEQEAAGKYEDALKTYRIAREFEAQLQDLAALSFPIEDLTLATQQVEDTLAATRYSEGNKAFTEEKYVEAISAWTAARSVRPNYLDTTTRMADAYVRLARFDLATKHYLEAASHYDASIDLIADPKIKSDASILHAAWGSWALQQGHCRFAYGELTKATVLDPTLTLKPELDAAERCSRVQVVVEPFEDQSGSVLRPIAPQLVSLLEAKLLGDGSPHLALIDPKLAPPLGPKEGTRFFVRGRLSRVEIARTAPRTDTKLISGTLLFTCTAADTDRFDVEHGFVCEGDAEASCSEHFQSVSVHLESALRIFDSLGQQIGTHNLNSYRMESHEWLTDCQRADLPITLGDRADLQTLAVDPATLALLQPPGPLPEDEALLTTATADWERQAAAAILNTIDAEPTIPLPPDLDLRSPNDPSKIEFRGANPTEVETAP